MSWEEGEGDERWGGRRRDGDERFPLRRREQEVGEMSLSDNACVGVASSGLRRSRTENIDK